MRRRLFLWTFLAAFSACDTTYKSNIPDATVVLELDLNYRDKDLIPPQAHKIYNPQNINQAYERTGFGGVLIYHSLLDTYVAFDAACPHEANPTVTVTVEDDNLHARCPKCQSQYDLSYGNANPVTGPSRQALKRYSVTLSANKLIIRN
ncbi:MAG: (2Fe-2S)-binding protein [Tannerellaceae bacterium]|jgi:nitrite reductase/ring-hydroxylating ferredoxin subunit|nr:(2Fe-2S)-binding protein [Tannerellaceae bacterium]